MSGFGHFLNVKSLQVKKSSNRACPKTIGGFTCEAIHLKLLTDCYFPDASQQLNAFLHQPQSQVQELILDDDFLTSASNYFLSTTNERGCHVTYPTLLFNSLLAFWVSPEGIPKILVFWVPGFPKLEDTQNTVTPPSLRLKGAWAELMCQVSKQRRCWYYSTQLYG